VRENRTHGSEGGEAMPFRPLHNPRNDPKSPVPGRSPAAPCPAAARSEPVGRRNGAVAARISVFLVTALPRLAKKLPVRGAEPATLKHADKELLHRAFQHKIQKTKNVCSAPQAALGTSHLLHHAIRPSPAKLDATTNSYSALLDGGRLTGFSRAALFSRSYRAGTYPTSPR